ncbi:MAG: hypothetical protein M1838_001640 [Thelocarpon superellum]|nr:MAG: hypothetical protein M1838_001640 [Thelocarpon superellum]
MASSTNYFNPALYDLYEGAGFQDPQHFYPKSSDTSSLGQYASNAEDGMLTPENTLARTPRAPYTHSEPDVSMVSEATSSDDAYIYGRVDPTCATPITSNSSVEGNHHHGAHLDGNLNLDLAAGFNLPPGPSTHDLNGLAQGPAGYSPILPDASIYANEQLPDDAAYFDVSLVHPPAPSEEGWQQVIRNAYVPSASPWCTLSVGPSTMMDLVLPETGHEVFDMVEAESNFHSVEPNGSGEIQRSSNEFGEYSMDFGHDPPENAMVALGSLPLRPLSAKAEMTSAERAKKVTKRTKKLSDEKRMQTNLIRQRRACSHCYFMKKPCSMGYPCEGCRNYANFRFHKVPCNYLPLVELVNIALPELLTEIHTEQRVNAYFQQHVGSIVTAMPPLTLVLGLGRPLSFEAQWYENKTDDLLTDPVFVYNPELKESIPRFAESTSVGVRSVPEKVLSAHLDDVVASFLPYYPDLYCAEHPNYFQRSVLRIVCHYHAASGYNQSSLLTRTLRLHILTFIMTHKITAPDTYAGSSSCPRLAGKQIKRVLSRMHIEAFQEVFTELERLLRDIRSKPTSTWPTAFPVTLLLMMSLEQMQLTIGDVTIFDSLRRSRDFMSSNVYRSTRDEGRHLCQLIEDQLVDVIRGDFHMSYKSHSSSGFNPFRREWNPEAYPQMDRATLDMINSMRIVLTTDWDFQLAKSVSIPTLEAAYAVPSSFAALNNSRLLTKFLMSFADR